MCGPISESLISNECQDISGSVEQKESIFRSWKHNIYQAVRAREGAMAKKDRHRLQPLHPGGKRNRDWQLKLEKKLNVDALTAAAASNMAPRSRFSPPLASPCLVPPPCSSTAPSHLTCLHLISLLFCPSFLLWFCFLRFMPSLHGGEKKTRFPFISNFFPITEQKAKDSFFILAAVLDEHISALQLLEFIFYFACVLFLLWL